MTAKIPPHVNGILEMTATKRAEVKGKLDTIIAGFVPDEFNGAVNTHWFVSEYNKANVGAEINGDTAEAILAEQSGV
jgi:hypothetical protein